MRALALALVTALAGCTCDAPSKPAAGSGSMQTAERARPAERSVGSGSAGAAGSAGPTGGSACTAETAIRVSRVLTDPAHPCRGWILAAYGRMVRVGPGSSGTIVSTAAARGAGLLATCGPCTGATGAELVEPEREPPLTVRIGAPARLAGGAVLAGVPRHAAHRLFGGEASSLAVISGTPLEPGAPPPPAVGDRGVALDDPRQLAASRAPFVDVRPGGAALVLGFALGSAGDGADGELLASVGPVLDEAEVRRLIARAGPAEAKLGFDPRTELAIAARAMPGMIGGGVFDEGGRFVGVVVSASEAPIDGGDGGNGGGGDGVHLLRAVRATAIASRLSAALRAAPVPLRAKVLPFLP